MATVNLNILLLNVLEVDTKFETVKKLSAGLIVLSVVKPRSPWSYFLPNHSANCRRGAAIQTRCSMEGKGF